MQGQADLQMRHHERRRHDLEAEYPFSCGLLDGVPANAPKPLPCRFAATRRSTSARYAPVPQHGSSTYTLSAAKPSAMPRSAFNALSTRATM